MNLLSNIKNLPARTLTFNDEGTLKRALQDHRHGLSFMHLNGSTGMTIYTTVNRYK